MNLFNNIYRHRDSVHPFRLRENLVYEKGFGVVDRTLHNDIYKNKSKMATWLLGPNMDYLSNSMQGAKTPYAEQRKTITSHLDEKSYPLQKYDIVFTYRPDKYKTVHDLDYHNRSLSKKALQEASLMMDSVTHLNNRQYQLVTLKHILNANEVIEKQIVNKNSLEDAITEMFTDANLYDSAITGVSDLKIPLYTLANTQRFATTFLLQGIYEQTDAVSAFTTDNHPRKISILTTSTNVVLTPQHFKDIVNLNAFGPYGIFQDAVHGQQIAYIYMIAYGVSMSVSNSGAMSMSFYPRSAKSIPGVRVACISSSRRQDQMSLRKVIQELKPKVYRSGDNNRTMQVTIDKAQPVAVYDLGRVLTTAGSTGTNLIWEFCFDQHGTPSYVNVLL